MPHGIVTSSGWMRRFWQKVHKPYPDGCWEWTGRTRDGYGRITINRKYATVHKLVYGFFIGPVSEGKVLDHLCRNTVCCNPSHLEEVTHKVNALRGIGPTAINAAKTHCIRGHEYTDETVIIRKCDGGRECRLCIKVRSQTDEFKLRRAISGKKHRNKNLEAYRKAKRDDYWKNKDQLQARFTLKCILCGNEYTRRSGLSLTCGGSCTANYREMRMRGELP